MANSAYYKTLLLALSLLLGNLIIIFMLFIPKIYAVYFVSAQVQCAKGTVAQQEGGTTTVTEQQK